MDRLHKLIGCGGDDGASAELISARGDPGIVQTGHAEYFTVPQTDERTLAIVVFAIRKAVCRNQASFPIKGILKAGLSSSVSLRALIILAPAENPWPRMGQAPLR